MPKSFLIKPADAAQRLAKRYDSQCRQWLSGNGEWPLVVPLGVPTEQQAFESLSQVQHWQQAWLEWKGKGELQWTERRWPRLGLQKLPERLFIHNPAELAAWIGQEEPWGRATQRYRAMTEQWPVLAQALPKYYEMLRAYSEADFIRLKAVLEWLHANPHSQHYIRQLPVEGVHTKWLLSRKAMVAELLRTIRGYDADRDFYELTGLKREPPLIRFRLLDEDLRRQVGGLGDISAALEDLRRLDIPVKRIYIVENLQSGLAFNDRPGSMVIMGLGYSVDLLRDIRILKQAPMHYWGDIDADGFAILNRLRSHFPKARSVLMDEKTLLDHKNFWGEDQKDPALANLPFLTEEERRLYEGLCGHKWAKNLRLEQERIPWGYVLEKLEIEGERS